jgi:UDP-N-acetylmuramate dehydrogenase
MKFQKNVSLKNYTTFKIGGRAKYFFIAKTKEDLIGAITTAKKIKLPFSVLGGGSNVLVSDKGFKGLVIKIENCKLKIKNCKVNVDAGVLLGKLVSAATGSGLTGLEWAAGIPGTVGGAVFGNAGAFQKSMKNVVKKVEVFDAKELRIENYELRDCRFGHRDSFFKRNKNLIILSVVLKLKKGRKSEIKKKIKEYLNYRKETHPLNYPSAGSVFKNPKGFSAGELIEKCGLKGKKIGQVQISEKHANFIVNLGNARAKDVKKLINLAKKEVKKKFKINLEEEIQFL